MDWVKLHWAEAMCNDIPPASYIVEFREIGDPLWYTANATVCDTTYLGMNLFFIDNFVQFS